MTKSPKKKRGKYKSYKSEEEQIKFRNAIEEFNQLQSTTRNANLHAFAEERNIGYNRIQPFCCKDPSKRKVFVIVGQKKLIPAADMERFCRRILVQQSNLDRDNIIQLLKDEFPQCTNYQCACNQYERAFLQTCKDLKERALSQLDINEHDKVLTACVTGRVALDISSITDYIMGPLIIPQFRELDPFVRMNIIALSYVGTDLYLNYGDKEINRDDALIMASAFLSMAHAIRAKELSPHFLTALYFQTPHDMNAPHELSQHQPPATKDRHKDHYGVWNSIASESVVVIGERGIYISQSIHKKPHGDFNLENTMPSLREKARDDGVELLVYPDGLQRALGIDMQVLRESSPELQAGAIRNFPEAWFFNHLRENVRPTTGDRHENETYVFDVGFSQPQPRSQFKVQHATIGTLPHFKQDGSIFMLAMPAQLRDRLGDLIMYVQDVTAALNPGAMSNDQRTELFAPTMQQRAFPSHPSIKIEYINFIVKRWDGGTLWNHMDYYNDGRKDYSYCPVYWYLHECEGVTYRVTIVMTFRNFCGVAADKL